MSGHCRGCRFWNLQRFSYVGTDRGGGEENPEWEYCSLATTADDGSQWGGYGPEGHGGGVQPVAKPSLALAYGDRMGTLKTHRDFSCIQWEPKP